MELIAMGKSQARADQQKVARLNHNRKVPGSNPDREQAILTKHFRVPYHALQVSTI